jgi:SAM-dependent methyltransferase
MHGSVASCAWVPPTGWRLNLGCGNEPLPGYLNIDRHGPEPIDPGGMDLESFLPGHVRGEVYPLDWPDGSVDEIRASHVLEHFSHREVVDVLRDWVRALKPGGTLKVAVPNFAWIAEQYLAGNPVNVQGYVMGGHADADDRHGAIFDEEELSTALRHAGCCAIRPWQSEAKDCAGLPVSLNLQGRKKGPLPKLKIAGAMSVPRLGFQDNFFCWFEALAPLGILPTKYDGCYWGQCLERVMTDQAAEGADYILTVDYDSVFTRDTVEDLIRLAVEEPGADAVAALEIRRGGDTILATIKTADAGRLELAVLQQDLVPVASAHFGLTLFKVEALRRLPHPWFLGVPNQAGEWGEGRTDEDTYFWRQWAEAGHTLFLAPHVVIGHGEFMLTWPRRGDLQPIYQHPAEFWAKGRPDQAWR